MPLSIYCTNFDFSSSLHAQNDLPYKVVDKKRGFTFLLSAANLRFDITFCFRIEFGSRVCG